MKFCSKCGNELIDEAVICTKCGCSTEETNVAVKSQPKKTSVSLILGIIGMVFAWLLAIIGHILSIIGIIIGIKEYREQNNMAGLIVSIVAELFAILSSIIGAVALSSAF